MNKLCGLRSLNMVSVCLLYSTAFAIQDDTAEKSGKKKSIPNRESSSSGISAERQNRVEIGYGTRQTDNSNYLLRYDRSFFDYFAAGSEVFIASGSESSDWGGDIEGVTNRIDKTSHYTLSAVLLRGKAGWPTASSGGYVSTGIGYGQLWINDLWRTETNQRSNSNSKERSQSVLLTDFSLGVQHVFESGLTFAFEGAIKNLSGNDENVVLVETGSLPINGLSQGYVEEQAGILWHFLVGYSF